MKFYRLNIHPGENETEGLDLDEWFTSLGAARTRRTELIRATSADDYKYGADFSIDEIELVNQPPRALLLAVLNRRGYVASKHSVVKPYSPPLDDQPDEDE
jgi:hypothetical protein